MTVARHALPGDPAHLKLAFTFLGVKEKPGKLDNALVVQFYAAAGHPYVKHDSVPWCAAFAGAVLVWAGMPHTGSLAARSYLSWGKATGAPKRGDVVIFQRGKSNWQGHVSFYLGEERGGIVCLGGNQSDAVKITRYGKARLLGYRTAMRLNPITGNSGMTKAQGLIGGGTAIATGGAAIAEAGMGGDSNIGDMLWQLGQSLMSMNLSVWLPVLGISLIGGGILWTCRERFGWWKAKGF